MPLPRHDLPRSPETNPPGVLSRLLAGRWSRTRRTRSARRSSPPRSGSRGADLVSGAGLGTRQPGGATTCPPPGATGREPSGRAARSARPRPQAGSSRSNEPHVYRRRENGPDRPPRAQHSLAVEDPAPIGKTGELTPWPTATVSNRSPSAVRGVDEGRPTPTITNDGCRFILMERCRQILR